MYEIDKHFREFQDRAAIGFARERRVDLSRTTRRTATAMPAQDRALDYLNEVSAEHPRLSLSEQWNLAFRENRAAYENYVAESRDADGFGGPVKESDTVGRGGEWARLPDVGRGRNLMPLPDSIALTNEVEGRIKALMDRNSRLTYAQAAEQIMKNDPNLYKRYSMAIARRAKP